MIIDAKDQVMGRVASFAAKQALLGEKIEIINCEEAVITGTKANILSRYKAKRQRGDPFHGPWFPRQPERLLRRTIRGMLPRRQEKGLSAYKRVMCYVGVPDAFKDQKAVPVKGAHISKMSNLRYIKVAELCRLLGGKS